MAASKAFVPGKNRLLDALPSAEYQRLSSKLEPVSLAYKKVLYEPGGPMPYTYFPSSGMTSLVIAMQDGAAIETAVVGNEGMVGVHVFLGTDSAPSQAYMQVAGEGLQMRSEELRHEARTGGPLRELLQRYALATLIQTAQLAACNRLHPVEERCARWLLSAHDRADSDILPLTQEFLGLMLGVRRASVTTTAAILQQAKLIDYQRGRITVLDRAGLEEAACECYGVMRRAIESVYGAR